MQDDIWTNFCSNVATLPLDDNATFIYSGRGGPNPLTRGRPTRFPGGGGLQTTIRPIKRDLALCQ
jgi:hypothetical protein